MKTQFCYFIIATQLTVEYVLFVSMEERRKKRKNFLPLWEESFFPVNAGLFFKSFFYIAVIYLKDIIM